MHADISNMTCMLTFGTILTLYSYYNSMENDQSAKVAKRFLFLFLFFLKFRQNLQNVLFLVLHEEEIPPGFEFYVVTSFYTQY